MNPGTVKPPYHLRLIEAGETLQATDVCRVGAAFYPVERPGERVSSGLIAQYFRPIERKEDRAVLKKIAQELIRVKNMNGPLDKRNKLALRQVISYIDQIKAAGIEYTTKGMHTIADLETIQAMLEGNYPK